jgi:hypothetical protein
MTWPIFGDHQLKLDTIVRIMSSADDIVVAILGGTLLEEAVERTLKERMRDDKDISDRLFGLTRPLASVSAQIDTLYMLHGIEKRIRDSMLIICKIRNIFAHKLSASFDSHDNDLKKVFDKLKLQDEFEFYPDARLGTLTGDKIEQATTNREKFIINLKLCLNFLMQDRCSHKTHSTEPVSYEERRKRFRPKTSE